MFKFADKNGYNQKQVLDIAQKCRKKIKAKQEDKILNEWRYLILNYINKEVLGQSFQGQSFNDTNTSISQSFASKSRYVLTERPIEQNKKDWSQIYKQKKVAKMKEKQKAENALVVPLILEHHKTVEYQKVLDISQIGIQAYAQIIKFLLFNDIPQENIQLKLETDDQFANYINNYTQYIEVVYSSFLELKHSIQSLNELPKYQIPEIEIIKQLIIVILYQKAQRFDILGQFSDIFQIQKINTKEKLNEIKELLQQCQTVEANILTFITSIVGKSKCPQSVLRYLEDNSSIYTHYQQRQKDFTIRMQEGIDLLKDQEKQHKAIKVLLDSINVLLPYKILSQMKKEQMDIERTLLQIIQDEKINQCIKNVAQIYSKIDEKKQSNMYTLSLILENDQEVTKQLVEQLIEVEEYETCLFILSKRENLLTQEQFLKYTNQCFIYLSNQQITNLYKILNIKQQDLQTYSQEQIIDNAIKNYYQHYYLNKKSKIIPMLLTQFYSQFYEILTNQLYSETYNELLKIQQLQNKLLLNITTNQAKNEIINNQIQIQFSDNITMDELQQKLLQQKGQLISEIFRNYTQNDTLQDTFTEQDTLELRSLQQQTTNSSYRSSNKKQGVSIFSLKNESESEDNSYIDTQLQLQIEDGEENYLQNVFQSIADNFNNNLEQKNYRKQIIQGRSFVFKIISTQQKLYSLIQQCEFDANVQNSYENKQQKQYISNNQSSPSNIFQITSQQDYSSASCNTINTFPEIKQKQSNLNIKNKSLTLDLDYNIYSQQNEDDDENNQIRCSSQLSIENDVKKKHKMTNYSSIQGLDDINITFDNDNEFQYLDLKTQNK